MSVRELVVLGTASQVPTRARAHHGALLRWDAEGVLFDPGEGTQRQLLLAGARASAITRICITHFHGDHCLGLPGILQRLSLDGITHPVSVYFPHQGMAYYERLRHASVFGDRLDVTARPCAPGVVEEAPAFRLVAAALDHRIPALGWRLEEPDGRTLLPDRLSGAGVEGPLAGSLLRDGYVDTARGRVTLEDVSVVRHGQVVAFVMDTALCEAAFELATGADLLVCEATFLEAHAELARAYGHLTAAQAGRLAAEAGVRLLVLTHFSQRYLDDGAFLAEARRAFDNVVVAHDLQRIPLPPRRQALR